MQHRRTEISFSEVRGGSIGQHLALRDTREWGAERDSRCGFCRSIRASVPSVKFRITICRAFRVLFGIGLSNRDFVALRRHRTANPILPDRNVAGTKDLRVRVVFESRSRLLRQRTDRCEITQRKKGHFVQRRSTYELQRVSAMAIRRVSFHFSLRKT